MSQHAPDPNASTKRARTGSLDAHDAARNAAAPDPREQARRRTIGLTLVLAVSGAAAIAALRMPDPMDGPRPQAKQMGALPQVIKAYKGLARGAAGKAPTPAQVAAAVGKTMKQPVAIVGPGQRTPNAVRLGGTPAAPQIELLDEHGEIAVYGDMPVVIPVEVN